MNGLIKRLCAFLIAFVGSIAIYHALPERRAPLELKASLVPCSVIGKHHRMLNPDAPPEPCNIYMAVEQTGNYSVNKAVPFTDIDRDPYLFESNCGTLTVRIASDNAMYINASNEDVGDASQPGELGRRLQSILDDRLRYRAYRENIENNPDFGNMTEEERIEPLTVFLRPACEVKYEDVLRVIDVIKSVDGRRIALQVSECENVDNIVAKSW